jgi:hypothetical protein
VWVGIGISLSLAAGVGAFFVLRGDDGAAHGGGSTATPSAIETATAPAETAKQAGTTVDVAPSDKPATPKDVVLKLKTEPPDCEVWLGETKLGLATDELRVPFGTEPVKLQVRHKGFISKDLDVTPSAPIADIVTLTAIVGKKKDYEW